MNYEIWNGKREKKKKPNKFQYLKQKYYLECKKAKLHRIYYKCFLSQPNWRWPNTKVHTLSVSNLNK